MIAILKFKTSSLIRVKPDILKAEKNQNLITVVLKVQNLKLNGRKNVNTVAEILNPNFTAEKIMLFITEI